METKQKGIEVGEGNKLIAEFMGATEKGFPLGVDMSGNEYFDKDYIYDWSWGALMPAVEKIETMRMQVDISRHSCFISDMNMMKTVIQKESESKIKATWLAVIEFIQNYN